MLLFTGNTWHRMNFVGRMSGRLTRLVISICLALFIVDIMRSI